MKRGWWTDLPAACRALLVLVPLQGAAVIGITIERVSLRAVVAFCTALTLHTADCGAWRVDRRRALRSAAGALSALLCVVCV